MAHHFAREIVELVEAGFGVGVFPEFSAVVEENAGDEEVLVEVGVSDGNGFGGAHHLSDVFDEAATAGVVVFASGSGAAEAVTEFFEEEFGESGEAGVGKVGDAGFDFPVVGGLFGEGFGIAGEELVGFVFGEGFEGPGRAIEAPLVFGEDAGEAEGGSGVEVG